MILGSITQLLDALRKAKTKCKILPSGLVWYSTPVGMLKLRETPAWPFQYCAKHANVELTAVANE